MGTRTIERCILAVLGALLLAFAACNGSSSNGSGSLSLSISDTPVDGATSVVVAFTGVEVKPAGMGGGMDDNDQGDMSGMGGMDDNQGDDDNQGSMTGTGGMGDDQGDDDDQGQGNAKPLVFDFATPHQIDLLQQQGGASATLLSGVSLPAGHYEWIRLKVDAADSSITLTDGSVHPLVIPSGDESGLKLVHGFDVAQGGIVSFVIDFDLRKSIVLAHGQYMLKPVLHIMDDLDVGRIDGSAANTLTLGSLAITDPACMPAAYVYAGDNVTPVDINPSASVQPVTSTALKLDAKTGDYVFTADFLAPGDYTVALACGALDDPSMSDSLTFSTPKNVTVTAGGTADVVFP